LLGLLQILTQTKTEVVIAWTVAVNQGLHTLMFNDHIMIIYDRSQAIWP